MKPRRLVALIAASAFLAMLAAPPAGANTATKTFTRIKGPVGYANQDCSPTSFSPVAAGSIVLLDTYAGVTHDNGQAAVVLPDSSEIDLGQNTCVALSAFNAVEGTTLKVVVGSLKFRVVHPKGGKSNYNFTTATSQVGVRGTVGLISTGPNGDTIACLQCEPSDVIVTILKTGQKIPLLTGQALTITLAGVVAAVTTAAVLAGAAGTAAGGSAFASVPTAATTGSAVGAGAGSAGAAAGAAAGGVAAGSVAAAAAVAVGAAAVANSNAKTNASPAAAVPTPTPLSSGVPFIFQDVVKHVLVKATPSPSPSPKSGGR